MALIGMGLKALGNAAAGYGVSQLASNYLGGGSPGRTVISGSGTPGRRVARSSSPQIGSSAQDRANAARAKEDARLAAQRTSPSSLNSSAQLEAQIRSPLQAGPTVVSARTDTPQAQADAEIRMLQTQLLKQKLQGPTSGVQAGMSALVNQYNRAFAQAKSQNEQRFEQMMGIANATTQQRAADIRTQGQQRIGDIRQRLARSGLGGSSVGNVEEEGIARSTSSQLNTLADAMQQTKLGILQQQQPAYPDLATLQSTLAGVSNQYEGGTGLPSLLTALSGIKS
jgi:hypothetical protein